MAGVRRRPAGPRAGHRPVRSRPHRAPPPPAARPGPGRRRPHPGGHTMIGKLRAFGAFWYDFIVGDDWQVAVGVVAALALTFVLGRAGTPAWWVVPLAVA